MKRGLIRKLTLGASCAVLLTGFGAMAAQAQETATPPTAENPAPPPQSGSGRDERSASGNTGRIG